MTLSALLASRVEDAAGRDVGPVRDVRLRGLGTSEACVAGIVVGRGRFAAIAHAWGFAEGAAQGPWVLRRLTDRAVHAARFVASEFVADWGPGTVRLTVTEDEL